MFALICLSSGLTVFLHASEGIGMTRWRYRLIGRHWPGAVINMPVSHRASCRASSIPSQPLRCTFCLSKSAHGKVGADKRFSCVCLFSAICSVWLPLAQFAMVPVRGITILLLLLTLCSLVLKHTCHIQHIAISKCQ